MAWRHTATSSVLRYPLKAFTEGTEYLQIDMQEYTPVGSEGATKFTGPLAESKNAFIIINFVRKNILKTM